MITGAPFTITIIELPLRFQSVNGASPLGAGTRLLPFIGLVPMGVIFASGLMGKAKIPPVFLAFVGSIIRTEITSLVFVTLALSDIAAAPSTAVDKILRVYKGTSLQCASDFEPEYTDRDGMLHIGRVTNLPDLNRRIQDVMTSSRNVEQSFGQGPPLALRVGSLGLLDSMHFVEDFTPEEPLGPGELEVEVACTGVNFRDCFTALGQMDTDSLGCECAGVVSRAGTDCVFKPGDRVAAVFLNTFQTYARGPADCAVKIPDSLPFTEASALLTVFCTAWYALCDVARLRRGESILIHAGAGGTGQAAVQVAKYLGANIYVTVGSTEKRHHLATTYGIAETNIFYSRDTSFLHGIMRETCGRGVDVVLNSLSGDLLVASWECIASVSSCMSLACPSSDRCRSVVASSRLGSATLSAAANFPCGNLERPVHSPRLIFTFF